MKILFQDELVYLTAELACHCNCKYCYREKFGSIEFRKLFEPEKIYNFLDSTKIRH